MSYRIAGLAPEPFAPLFELDDAALAERHALRMTVGEADGVPCRISLRDAEPGDEVLLLNYLHLPVDSPYRARHAIYVNRRADTAFDEIDHLPPVFTGRMLSLRGFDDRGMLRDGDLVDGAASEKAIERLFDNPKVSYLHAHFAVPGCFAARIERA